MQSDPPLKQPHSTTAPAMDRRVASARASSPISSSECGQGTKRCTRAIRHAKVRSSRRGTVPRRALSVCMNGAAIH